ncbi:MAG: hypothetical protein EXS16_11900 [Gemmataceae bacterium]|nr:hypothetical protein [Gemmataceae bacterium]
MSAIQTRTPRPLPGIWSGVGGLAAIAHLSAVAMLAMAAPSGPWPFNGGASFAEGPQFAKAATINVIYPYYLSPLRMTHNYRFQSNNVALTGIYLEVRLKDEFGNVTKTLKFPDDKANFWVRHRHKLLAQALGEDQPAQNEGTERIGPAGNVVKRLPTKEIWEPDARGVLHLTHVERVPTDRDVFRPSPSAKVLAQSYLRFLCNEHMAVSAELIRHSRQAVMPMILFMPDAPDPQAFHELESNFGEYRREK